MAQLPEAKMEAGVPRTEREQTVAHLMAVRTGVRTIKRMKGQPMTTESMLS